MLAEGDMKIGQKNKTGRLLLLLAALGMSSFSLGGYLARGFGQEELIDWDKVKSTFQSYLRDPVPERVKAFLDTVPAEKTKNQTGNKSAAVHYIDENYLTLEAGVLAGDRCLTEAAFRLLNFADGAFAQTLNEILGDLAIRNPRLFIKVLYKYRNSWFVKNAGPPVFGTSHEDNAEDLLEWRKRIKALKTVKETKYRQIRDVCIRILEEAIEKYQAN
jgi:hypothetical protein